jgi:hypothetical protein
MIFFGEDMVNLFLAVLWLVLSSVFFAWEWTQPNSHAPRIWGSNVSVGWIAVVLAVYNLARWWSSQSFARRSGAAEDSKWRLEDHRKIEEAKAVDPNLSFTDEPPHSER